jgi:membrane protein required for colicin V production
VVDFIQSLNLVDLVIVVGLVAMFILGFIQGSIRRLLGLASILFSFLVASALYRPVGDFLGSNWTQFPPQYGAMIGYGAMFLLASIAFSLVIQGFYKRQDVFAKAPVLDEVIGGLLGVVEGLVLIGVLIVVLDSFFAVQGFTVNPNELPFLRSIHGGLADSAFAQVFRTSLIPGAFSILGFMIPEQIRSIYVQS